MRINETFVRERERERERERVSVCICLCSQLNMKKNIVKVGRSYYIKINQCSITIFLSNKKDAIIVF